ncbi:hypothetical protein [Propioniciclava tarda]|nr:hypothetical protein [Propioniciclava tarda]SMO55614.1 hypothetical protein SAMN06266982_10688 [Propioniciclava tarda]
MRIARKLVKALRRYRTVQIKAGNETVTAEDPLPDGIRAVLDAIYDRTN